MAVTLGTWASNTSAGNGGSWNYTVPSGTDRYLTYFLGFEYATGGAPSAVTATIGGVSLTAVPGSPSLFDNGSFVQALYSFYLLDASIPAAGVRAVVGTVTGATGLAGIAQAVQTATGAQQIAPTYVENGASALTLTLASTIASGGAAVAVVTMNGPTATFAGSNATWTERFDVATGDTSFAGADTTTAGADTLTITQSASNRIAGALLVIAGPAVGPTIDTQPSAATVRINGEASAPTATFTVAATTSGGSLTYDWELETSVGGGSYSNLADGSGATWTGQTASSCVSTFSAKTLSGRRVRCNVTDSNGTTTTDAVVLTVLDGPVLSASSATTNGSGVASVTMTSDDALTANGEILLVTATVRGQVVARTTVRPA